MRVRGRVAVIAAATVSVQFQDVAGRFEDGDRLVHGGQAEHGVIHLHAGMDLLGAGVLRAVEDDLQHCHALRGDAAAARFQAANQCVQAGGGGGGFSGSGFHGSGGLGGSYTAPSFGGGGNGD